MTFQFFFFLPESRQIPRVRNKHKQVALSVFEGQNGGRLSLPDSHRINAVDEQAAQCCFTSMALRSGLFYLIFEKRHKLTRL